jgi:hypothetical protein
MWVASSTTSGAIPASSASCQRSAQRHHWYRLQSGAAELGVLEVVAGLLAEVQELRSHAGADHVNAGVFSAGVAAAVPIEAGQGLVAARLQLAAEDVLGHAAI